jgi:hypothetical protein
LEKCINSVIFFILKRSSKFYYSNIFIRTLAQTTPPLPQALQNVQKAQIKAASDYVPYVYPGRPVLFRASQQPPGIYKDQLLGWGVGIIGALTAAVIYLVTNYVFK